MLRWLAKTFARRSTAAPLGAHVLGPAEPARTAAPESWQQLGNSFLKANNLPEAVRCYRAGILADPQDAVCHSNLGFVLAQMGQLQEAAQMLGTAVARNPADFDAYYLLGNLARDRGDTATAMAYYRTALRTNPDFEYCRRDLCLLLAQIGQPQEARLVMDQGSAFDKDSGDYFKFKGNMHLACAEYPQAEAALRQASQLQPLDPDILTNLGAAQIGKRDVFAAVKTYDALLKVAPDNVSAHANRAAALQLGGQTELAIQSYRQALRLDPQYLYGQQNLLYVLTYAPTCTPAEYLQEARSYGKKARAAAKPYPIRPDPALAAGARALRVGFVSGDLRMHPVGYFLDNILAHLERKRITCIAYSNAVVEDAYSSHLRAVFSEWHPVFNLSDAELAAKIVADNIDILVDLAGHTAHNRLAVFAWRAAAVQVAWLGYWASTGVAEVDYIVVDPVSVRPDEAQHYSEQPWFLPDTRLCLSPPSTPAPASPTPLPALRNGYVTFGSFQSLGKISEASLAAWSSVLALVPTARLRLQSYPLGFPDALAHMRTRLVQAQIDPARVEMLGGSSREAYLQAYSQVDIVLDTFPFPGGTTTSEALWMGVPTLTLSGNTLLARQGESMLRCAGLPDWVASSTAQFVQLAAEKAADLAGLAQLRAGLRQNLAQTPLFDGAVFAKNLESAFYGMAGKAGLLGVEMQKPSA